MANTLNGTVIDVITEEGEDGHPLPRVLKKDDREGCKTSPLPRGFHGDKD